jgi:hypothetical protein
MLNWIRQHLGRDRRFVGGGRRRSRKLQKLPFYRRYTPAGVERLAAIDKRIMISLRNEFIYVRVPKCANSTIMLMLGLEELNLDGAHWAGLPPAEQRRFFTETLKRQTFRHPSDLTLAETADALERFRRIMFVRNPFTRVASAYLDKVASGKYERLVGLQGSTTFSEFCDYLASGGLRRNIHWLPQTLINPFPVESLDKVGRFENLDADLANLTRELHGREQPTISLANHATNAGQRILDLYSDHERRLIAELYADDFTTFGYDPDRLPE